MDLSRVQQAAKSGEKVVETVKCNAMQSRGMGILFREILHLCAFWSLMTINTQEGRDIVAELVQSVNSAVRLVKGYTKSEWSTTAIFRQENAQGFAQAAKVIWRYVQILNRHIQSQTEMSLEALHLKVQGDMAFLDIFLAQAAAEDRKNLKEEAHYAERRFFKASSSTSKKPEILKMKAISPNDGFILDPKDVTMGRVLGEGVSGKVYKGTWLGSTVAIKEVKSEEDIHFEREAQFLKTMTPHPNIVQVIGASGKLIVMELMERNLSEHMKMFQLTDLQVLDIMLQIAMAMEYLHEKDICYRDLKPLNVLMRQEADVCLADCGHSGANFLSMASHDSLWVGTPAYMALEVLEWKPYTKKSDVWSFGVTCLEVWTRKPLEWLRRTSMHERVEAVQKGSRPSIPDACPWELKQLIKECWDRDPEKRPAFPYIVERLWHIKEIILNDKWASLSRQVPIKYQDLKILHEDGWASFYEGVLPDGTGVLVSKWKAESQDAYIRERDILGRLHHKNILKLVGSCVEPLTLVYAITPNGSLDKWIDRDNINKINWVRRLNIMVEVARGLKYLREEGTEIIFHSDIKPMNIWLDKDFSAQIGGFAISASWPIDQEYCDDLPVRGTPGYIAPRSASVKCDVYSFGVVLLQMVTGRRVIDMSKRNNSDSDYLPVYVSKLLQEGKSVMELVDPPLHDADEVQVERVVNIALQCVQEDDKLRPSTGSLVQDLEHLL